MTETREQTIQRLHAMVNRMEADLARHYRTEEANAANRRRRDAVTLLEYAIPDFAAPLRSLRQGHEEEVSKVRNDPNLTDEAKERWLHELATEHRKEVREKIESVRDRHDSFLSRYRAIAKVNDEPADELRYSRLEREFMAKIAAGQTPDLKSYWEAIESGDRDLVRVYETYASLHIEDNARKQEFDAEIQRQRQHRLTDEQKLARQRIRELQARIDDFEMGLRVGVFGQAAREAREVLDIGADNG